MEGGGRFVGVAVDFSACSNKALKWAIDNILRKGDHLILVTVRPEGHYEEGEMQLWEATGSRMPSSLHLYMYYLLYWSSKLVLCGLCKVYLSR